MQLEEEKEDSADWGTAEVFREGRVCPQDQTLHRSQAGLTSWVSAVSAEGKKRTRGEPAEESMEGEGWGQCQELWQEGRS